MGYSTKEVLAYSRTPEGKAAQEELNRMLVRSATDMEFRRKLLTNPNAAFAEHGSEIPDGWDIRFIENEHDATIVLPDAVDPAAELSEEELEAVAGGAIFIVIVSSTGCAALASAAVSYLTSKL